MKRAFNLKNMAKSGIVTVSEQLSSNCKNSSLDRSLT